MSEVNSLPPFSHIYIEKDAKQYPDTSAIIERFPKALVIEIENYKEVFNRPRQNWDHQKSCRKLILATRKEEFLYQGSPSCHSFGQQNFFYNTLVMNCTYDCSYCYLQGLYPSANLVLFVNIEDYLKATQKRLEELGSLFLTLSYDSDLLALDGIFPVCDRWLSWAENNPNCLLEIRTKSSNYNSIGHCHPPPNVILAWTISPEEIAKRYERKSPPPSSRINAAAQAIAAGWKVRLSFDPIIALQGWERLYEDMIDQVFSIIDPHKIHDVSFGPFRMSSQALKKIQEESKPADILFADYTEYNNLCSYPEEVLKAINLVVGERLNMYLDSDRIFPFNLAPRQNASTGA